MQKISFINDKNMATIIRQSYIDKIEKYLGKEIIIVLVGQRRVGKSCMMKMIRDRKKADDCNNIIFIDKEKREFDCIQTYLDLNDYIGEHFYLINITISLSMRYKTSRNLNDPFEVIAQNPTPTLSSQVAMLAC